MDLLPSPTVTCTFSPTLAAAKPPRPVKGAACAIGIPSPCVWYSSTAKGVWLFKSLLIKAAVRKKNTETESLAMPHIKNWAFLFFILLHTSQSRHQTSSGLGKLPTAAALNSLPGNNRHNLHGIP